MNNDSKTEILLYENLGKLFYAITACDGKVRSEEYKALQSLLKNHWFDHHSIILETYNKYYLEAANAENMFDGFTKFLNEHKSLFSENTKVSILNTVGALASIVNSVNKSELILIAKLSLLFKNLDT